MNLQRFIFLYIMFWCSNYATEVQSITHRALIFEQELRQLTELNEDNQCTDCIIACSVSSKFIDQFSRSGYGLFLQQVFDGAETSQKIETNICDISLTPSILWDTLNYVYEIGYELFYDDGKLDFTCPFYDEFQKIIDGKPDQNKREFTENMDQEGGNTKFKIEGENNLVKTMVFYWIPVLIVEDFPSGQQRQILFTKDVINDIFHKERVMSQCENYYVSIGTQIVPLKQEQIEPEHSVDSNRLEKTQILPMHMLHTLPGRLASCMYANVAFIWNTIANGQLQEVDLFLYTLYKLWPSNIKISFGVKGQLKDISSGLNTSENEPFRESPIPEIIYRVVEWTNGKVVYKILVVIHNNPNPIGRKHRICSPQTEDWVEINTLDQNTTLGTSYTCPMSRRVIYKMGLYENDVSRYFRLSKFPITDNSGKTVSFIDVSEKVHVEFNRLKNLGK